MKKQYSETVEALVNELIPARDDGNMKPGQIALANEARFTSNTFSQALTQYAVGWRDPANLDEALDFVAPPIQVSRRFEWKKAEGAEAFLSETDDERAIGAAFKEVEYKGTSVNDKTINKGLTMCVDNDEVAELPGWQEQAVSRLLQRLKRSEYRRGTTLLAAAGTNTGKTWDATAGKDPDADVLSDLATCQTDSGILPNRVLYGSTAWAKRILSLRAQSSAGGFANSGMTEQQLAAFLGVDSVRVAREIYQSTKTVKAQIVSNLVLEFYAQAGLSKDDPSHTKRFWSPCKDGTMYRVYVSEEAKTTKITVEHYSIVVVTSTTGVRKLTVS
jgi:hypothetical protein